MPQQKTISTFIGHIVKTWGSSPVLIIALDSAIVHWLETFAQWAPNLRVIPFVGSQQGLELIKTYEIQHTKPIPSTTGLKFHVLVTTHDIAISETFTPIAQNVARWEVLIMDHGQQS